MLVNQKQTENEMKRNETNEWNPCCSLSNFTCNLIGSGVHTTSTYFVARRLVFGGNDSCADPKLRRYYTQR